MPTETELLIELLGETKANKLLEKGREKKDKFRSDSKDLAEDMLNQRLRLLIPKGASAESWMDWFNATLEEGRQEYYPKGATWDQKLLSFLPEQVVKAIGELGRIGEKYLPWGSEYDTPTSEKEMLLDAMAVAGYGMVGSAPGSAEIGAGAELGMVKAKGATKFLKGKGKLSPKELAESLGITYQGEWEGLGFHEFLDPKTGGNFTLKPEELDNIANILNQRRKTFEE